jgi:hypothetical protein
MCNKKEPYALKLSIQVYPLTLRQALDVLFHGLLPRGRRIEGFVPALEIGNMNS